MEQAPNNQHDDGNSSPLERISPTSSANDLTKANNRSLRRASVLMTPRTRRSTTIRSATAEVVAKIYVKIIIGLFWQRKTEEFIQLIVDCERNRALLREINQNRELDELTVQNKQSLEKVLKHLEEKLGVFISLPVQISPEALSSIHSLLNNSEGKGVNVLREEISSILVSYNIVTQDETQYLSSILLNLLEVMETFSNRKSDMGSPAKPSLQNIYPVVSKETSEISKLYEKSVRFRSQAIHFMNTSYKNANKEFFGSLKSVFSQERRDNLSYLSATNKFTHKEDEVLEEHVLQKTDPIISLNEIHLTLPELKNVFPAPPESQFSPVEEKKEKDKLSKESSSSTLKDQRRYSSNNLHSTLQIDLEAASESSKKMEEMLHPEWIGNLTSSYFESELKPKHKSMIMHFLFNNSPDFIKKHQSKAAELFFNALQINITAKKNEKKEKEKPKNFVSLQQNLKKVATRSDLQIGGVIPRLLLPEVILTFSTSKAKALSLGETKASQDISIKVKGRGTSQVRCFCIGPCNGYRISFSPNQFEVKKTQSTKLSVEITIQNPVRRIQELIVLEVLGGPRYFLGIDLYCEVMQFGADPRKLELVTVAAIGDVPVLLENLKKSLIQHEGLKERGIFRESGNGRKLKEIKAEINTGNYTDITDVHIASNLIKMWFRELPEHLFHHVGMDEMLSLHSQDIEACQELVQTLPLYKKALFDWLIDLMLLVEEHNEVNLMKAHNLAIVFAPNLYSTNNPGLMLKISDQISKVIENLIYYEKAKRNSMPL